jgi:hypothetical protein
MKRLLPIIFLLLLISSFPVAAQEAEETLVLGFTRDFGFAAGGKIQGTFSLKVREPEDLIRVEFLIDDEVVHDDQEAPFRFQFNTAAFSTGTHTLSAVGYKVDGSVLHSNTYTRDFISGEDAWSSVGDILVPLLIGIGAVTVLAVLGPVLLGRKKKFRPGEYGMAGGAVCRKCSMPFSRNVLSPNLMVGKLERCPHCGKWAIVPRASKAELEAAEARLTQEGPGTLQAPSEEERLRSLIDDTRFDD